MKSEKDFVSDPEWDPEKIICVSIYLDQILNCSSGSLLN